MSNPLISARGLTKKFGDFTAVNGIDFDVFKGDSFGFLGPNGAGKSTAMRIIGATSQRTSGTITILDKDPEVHGPQIRAHLGVVPQQAIHLNVRFITDWGEGGDRRVGSVESVRG